MKDILRMIRMILHSTHDSTHDSYTHDYTHDSTFLARIITLRHKKYDNQPTCFCDFDTAMNGLLVKPTDQYSDLITTNHSKSLGVRRIKRFTIWSQRVWQRQ